MKKSQSKKKRFNPILMPINSTFMNISNTDANSLSFIKRFDQLTNLIASNTLITDLKGVQISESILHIQLEGTPFSKNKFYRIMLLIGLSPLIRTIDKDEVTSYERDLANILQGATLLLIYQGYLITNLDPLTLFLNLNDNYGRVKNNDSNNGKTVIIAPEKIVIGTKQSLSQIKAQQTFAMIEDLSNEIQKTANDWKIQPIKKNEVGDLLNEIKKVHNANNKKIKKIQKKRNSNQISKTSSNIENNIDNITDLKSSGNSNENKKAVDYQIYLSLIKMLDSNKIDNDDTITNDDPKPSKNDKKQEEIPKSPKLSKSELVQKIKERRKQNSSILENSLIGSTSKNAKSELEITSINRITVFDDIDKNNNRSSILDNSNFKEDEETKINDSNIDNKNNGSNKSKIKVIVKKKKKKIIKTQQNPKNPKGSNNSNPEDANSNLKTEQIAITKSENPKTIENLLNKSGQLYIQNEDNDNSLSKSNIEDITTEKQLKEDESSYIKNDFSLKSDKNIEQTPNKSYEEERMNAIISKIQKQRNKAKNYEKISKNSDELIQREINTNQQDNNNINIQIPEENPIQNHEIGISKNNEKENVERPIQNTTNNNNKSNKSTRNNDSQSQISIKDIEKDTSQINSNSEQIQKEKIQTKEDSIIINSTQTQTKNINNNSIEKVTATSQNESIKNEIIEKINQKPTEYKDDDEDKTTHQLNESIEEQLQDLSQIENDDDETKNENNSETEQETDSFKENEELEIKDDDINDSALDDSIHETLESNDISEINNSNENNSKSVQSTVDNIIEATTNNKDTEKEVEQIDNEKEEFHDENQEEIHTILKADEKIKKTIENHEEKEETIDDIVNHDKEGNNKTIERILVEEAKSETVEKSTHSKIQNDESQNTNLEEIKKDDKNQIKQEITEKTNEIIGKSTDYQPEITKHETDEKENNSKTSNKKHREKKSKRKAKSDKDAKQEATTEENDDKISDEKLKLKENSKEIDFQAENIKQETTPAQTQHTY